MNLKSVLNLNQAVGGGGKKEDRWLNHFSAIYVTLYKNEPVLQGNTQHGSDKRKIHYVQETTPHEAKHALMNLLFMSSKPRQERESNNNKMR